MGTFTGKHMAATMIGGFGIVVAVNFTMASLATGGFGGVVVENSYVASQKYNEWLEEAERQRATGWDASVSRRADGAMVVQPEGGPDGIAVTATARPPLGKREVRDLAFQQTSPGAYVSREPLAPGRWTVRVTLAGTAGRRTIEADIS